MMKKALLAATVATGLLMTPAQAGLYVPPKPAIIKPENIEFSKHMLLGMPITMGMLVAKAAAPQGINANNGGKSTVGAASWSHTTTSATTCLVVLGGLINNSQTNEITGVKFGGVALTLAVNRNQTTSTPHISIWYLLNPTVGTATITCSGSTDRYLGGVSFNLAGVTAFDVAATNSNTTGTLTVSATSTALGVVVGGSMINSASTDTLGGDITKLAANSAVANSITRVCSGGYSSTTKPAGSRSVTSSTSSALHAAAIAVFK